MDQDGFRKSAIFKAADCMIDKEKFEVIRKMRRDLRMPDKHHGEL
jgi:hypothetical protein